MMRSRFSVFMISRQEYVFICMFLSHEFFKHLFREIVKAFVSCTGSLTFPSVQYLIIKTKAGFKQGSMYLTRKGAPVRLVIPSARHSPSVTFTSSREA